MIDTVPSPYLTIAISVVAIAATVALGLYVFFKNREVAHANLDQSVRKNISDAKRHFASAGTALMDFHAACKGEKPTLEHDIQRLKTIELNLNSALEDLITQYEVACGYYLDGRVNRRRFKLTYEVEINRIAEAKEPMYVKLMHPADTCDFEALWKVYRRWNHKE